MIDLKALQKDVYANKVAKGFNVEDVHLEFNYLYGEVAEACEAYRKKKPDLGEELADVAIYLLGLAEILNVNLEQEILAKHEKNKQREYAKVNGVLTRTKEAQSFKKLS